MSLSLNNSQIGSDPAVPLRHEANLMQEAKLLQGPTEVIESKAKEEVQQDQATRQEDMGVVGSLQNDQKPLTPISPTPRPTLPFSVAIQSINTTERYHVAKEGSPPFTLTFNHGARHYDISDQHHHPSYFLQSFHPLDLKIVAWAPGSLQVHTQTKDYVKKKGTGQYMNLTVSTVEDLKELVEDLKARGVEAWKMEL
ncbi:MAG: hypothetical protein Q9178_004165 [Gyalolechia marmorata]